jgi:hypothetical protein
MEQKGEWYKSNSFLQDFNFMTIRPIAPSKYLYNIMLYMSITYYLLVLLNKELFMIAVAYRVDRRPGTTCSTTWTWRQISFYTLRNENQALEIL